MVLYSKKVYELSKESENDELDGSLSYLNAKEKEFLAFLLKKRLYEFTPIEVSKMLGVTNKTIINRCAKLVNNGLLIPIIVKTRIRSYRLSDFSKTNEKKILKKYHNRCMRCTKTYDKELFFLFHNSIIMV